MKFVFCLFLNNFEIDLEVSNMFDNITRLWNQRFKEWKYKLRMHYKTLETHEEALNNSPHGFEHRMNE